ncbi:hypothetical protein Glove_41g105 [Diversispora epigaea]|uniref:Uncharacterized protein n=1 Tax=Diversispora epigaea TaxID=1348612 RepID=A0A397JHB7_9GLOM|nr:hypothetical protein Glove_41g105 [Diversispora epigaea]
MKKKRRTFGVYSTRFKTIKFWPRQNAACDYSYAVNVISINISDNAYLHIISRTISSREQNSLSIISRYIKNGRKIPASYKECIGEEGTEDFEIYSNYPRQ